MTYSQSIRGVVIENINKEPVPGASVQIRLSNLAVQTTSSGYFEFKGLPNGSYTIEISYLGYSTQEQKVDYSGKEINLIITLQEQTTQLKEVQVRTRANHESDISARRKEKTADNLVNIVSAQSIARSPDLNAAEVSKRISGISLQKSSDSKDELLIIRGLEPRYSNTTLNGAQIPSPDDKNKTVPLNIFPSELIGNVVVSKTLVPDMALDAIGGTVDIQFKDAPTEPILNVNFAGGFNPKVTGNTFYTFNPSPSHILDPAAQYGHQYSAKPSDFPASILKFYQPSFRGNLLGGFTFSKRFFKNKLGFIVSTSDEDSYSENRENSQNVEATENKTASNQNKPQSSNAFNRYYYYHSNNFGVSSKLDYIFNDRNKISLSTVITRTQNIQALSNETTPVPDLNGNIVGIPPIDSLIRSQNIIQGLYSTSLKGFHKIRSNFTIDYTLNYGYAKASAPDQADLLLYNDLQTFQKFPNTYIIEPNSTSRVWQRNFDRYYGSYLNFSYKTKLFGLESEFKVGGVLSHKNRYNYRNSYLLNAVYTGNNTAVPFSPNFQDTTFLVVTAQGNPTINTDNYAAFETLKSFYFQDRFKIGKLDVVLGARDEITRQNWTTRSVNAPFGQLFHDYGYNDFSPEINLKYNIKPNQAFRLSYYQAISRPNYYDLVSYTNNAGTGNQAGNPNLRHSRSYNFDARYEIFSGGDNALLVGAFYKRIIDPIETSYSSGSAVQTNTLVNAPDASDYGAELNLIHYFGDFGISGNYTFISSQIKQRKTFYVDSLDPGGVYTGYAPDRAPIVTRPLQGQSKSLANASILYRNRRSKFNANFSILFQGRRLDNAVQEYLLDYYQQDYWNFSFAADKTFGKRFALFFKAINITNTPIIIRTPGGYFISANRSGQDFLLGVRYKLLGLN